MASGGRTPKDQAGPVSSVTHIQALALSVNSLARPKILYTSFQAEPKPQTTLQPGTHSGPIVNVLTFLQGQSDRGALLPETAISACQVGF